MCFESSSDSSSDGDESIIGYEYEHNEILKETGFVVGPVIAAGAFASIRKAKNILFKQEEDLVVKVIPCPKGSSMWGQKFALREARFVSQLSHRNIIRVDHVYQIKDDMLIFMEHAERGNLCDYMNNQGGILSEARAKIFFRQIVSGLSYIHSKGVSHRDLKEPNILIGHRLRVLIADFGLSRHCLAASGKVALCSTQCESFPHMAPEVVHAEDYNGFIADVWSIGVVLYVMVNGQLPFDPSNLHRLYENQMTNNWEFVADTSQNLSKGIKRLVKCMLEPYPQKRITINQILRSTFLN